MVTLADIRAAAARIAPAAVRTPLVRLDPEKLRAFGITHELPAIYLKDESAQPIRSFKLRGAYNKIAQLTPDQLAKGVITYSSGNHAQGVAFAARALGGKAVIVMPANSPPIKIKATEALGAEIVFVGPASTERKQRAEALAAAHGYTIVPPYDDPAIIAGQATCGLEIIQQLPDVDLVLSPVSGGGLLSGVATAVKLSQHPRVPHPSRSHRDEWGTRDARFEWDGLQAVRSGTNEELGFSPGGTAPSVYGCEPAIAPDAKQSFDTRILTELPAALTTRTICDGLRTQSLGELNFQHILKYVNGIISVPESEIRLATRIIFSCTDIVAEPSGAITLAAALFHRAELPAAKTIVAIVSGGNLDPALRAELEAEAVPTPA
jgi:threonine dehydratase